jgi:hypothetical protein
MSDQAAFVLSRSLKVYCAAEGRELSVVVSEAVEAFIQVTA